MHQSRLCTTVQLVILLTCLARPIPCLAAGAATVDDTLAMLSEGDEVVAATRRSQPVREAPSAVTVITADEIRTFGYRTLAETLEHTRGFFVTRDRNYSYLGSRGFTRTGDYNSRVQVLINGQRLNDNVYGAVAIGNDLPLDLELVDRIEVVRGPGSAVYGSNAVFAVVNIITREPEGVQGTSVAAAGGSFGTGQASVTHGSSPGAPVRFLASGTALASHGQDLRFPEFDSGGPDGGTARNADHERTQKAFARLRSGDWSVQGLWSERAKEVPTASFGTIFNDGREATTDGRALLQAGFDHAFGGGRRFELSLAYDRTWYRGLYPYDYPPVTINVDEEVGEWLTATAIVHTKPGPQTRWTLGTEFQENYRVKQRNFDRGTVAEYLDTDNPFRVASGFAEMEQRFGARVIASLGARYDWRSDSQAALNPRLAMVFLPRPRTTIKLLAGTAFRAPNAYELFYNDPGQIETTGSLRPEKITTAEFLWEERIGGSVEASLSAFHYRLRNLINQLPDPLTSVLTTRNTGDVRSNGVETEVRFMAAKGVTGMAWIAFSRSRLEDEEFLPGSPSVTAHFALRFPLPRTCLDLAPTWRFVGGQRSGSGDRIGSYGVADLTLSNRRAWRGWTLSASLYNLTDTRHSDVVGPEFVQEDIPQDGRSFRFSSRRSF